MPTVASSGARRALSRLAGELDLVAVVTGRAVERAQRMVGVDEHRLRRQPRPGMAPRRRRADRSRRRGRPAPALTAALARRPRRLPRARPRVEDKRVSAAIHYRLAVRPGAGRADAADAPRAVRGDRPPAPDRGRAGGQPAARRSPIDKGEATRRLVEQHGLRSVAFFGDDVTDLDAFRALHALRASGTVTRWRSASAARKGRRRSATKPICVLEGVGEVERVLAALATRPPRREGRTTADAGGRGSDVGDGAAVGRARTQASASLDRAALCC